MNVRLLISTALMMGVVLGTSPAIAQVRSDDSLSTVVTTLNGRDFWIWGGAKRGNNLFHSFDEFSVPGNGSAIFAEFRNGVRNIIGRVTGDRPSIIDGHIRTLNGANLFLINPNGIVIGANATLDIRGSFLASTAESLIFQDGTVFSSNDASPPLLTASIPVGLQMGANPGSIAINTPNFTLPADQDVVFVGGSIVLNGVGVDELDSNIQLGSFSSTDMATIDVGFQTIDLLSIGGQPISPSDEPEPDSEPDPGTEPESPDDSQEVEDENPDRGDRRSDRETPGIQDPDTPADENGADDSPPDTTLGNTPANDGTNPDRILSTPDNVGILDILDIPLENAEGRINNLEILQNFSLISSSPAGQRVATTNRSGESSLQETVAAATLVNGSDHQEVVPTCSPTASNAFLISGRGSLPESPASDLGGEAIWRDVRFLPLSDSASSDSVSSDLVSSTASSQVNPLPGNRRDSVPPADHDDLPALPSAAAPSEPYPDVTSPIVEAQGWLVTETGHIRLVAPGQMNTHERAFDAQHSCSSHTDVARH